MDTPSTVICPDKYDKIIPKTECLFRYLYAVKNGGRCLGCLRGERVCREEREAEKAAEYAPAGAIKNRGMFVLLGPPMNAMKRRTHGHV